jgi:ATP-dependent Lhr-like helicase
VHWRTAARRPRPKTEASIFPTLSHAARRPADGVGALYIAPIKALLNNQAERLGTYTEMVGLRRFVWHGDTTSHERRTASCAEPAELLMTTPESLEVMFISQKGRHARRLFADLRIVIIDEVHAIAGTDRGAHLLSVLERIARTRGTTSSASASAPRSATPRTILKWLQGTSKRVEATIVDPPKQPAKRQLLVAHRPELAALARDAARRPPGAPRACSSARPAPSPRPSPSTCGVQAPPCSSITAPSRWRSAQLAEERFHHGSDACIVCTSTLELGIDVGDLDRVLQPRRPTPSARSCSAWAEPAAAPAKSPTPLSSARPPRACSSRSR